mmetsp:Transcript_5637/g.4032  ORF Transcript_5637/g.4032 Transcript_5637/m.4032 type:complete len:228 (+) Transcript_5637:305-988(+)
MLVILEEFCETFMTFRSVCITKVVVKVSQRLGNELLLLFSEHVLRVVKLAGCALKFIRLGGLKTGFDYFLYSLLSIGSFNVFDFKEELLDTLKFLLLVAHNIFIPHEANIIFATLSFFDNLSEELLHDATIHLNKLVPPLRVLFMNCKLRFHTVVHANAEASERDHNIKWISGNKEHLVYSKWNRIGGFTWMMCLRNKNGIIDNVLSLQSHDLQRGGSEQRNTRACS